VSAMDDENWDEYWMDAWTDKNSVGCAIFEIVLVIAIAVFAIGIIYWSFILPMKTWTP
jgi:hypothetical protein